MPHLEGSLFCSAALSREWWGLSLPRSGGTKPASLNQQAILTFPITTFTRSAVGSPSCETMKRTAIVNTANETNRIAIVTAINAMRNQLGSWVKGIAYPEEPELRWTRECYVFQTSLVTCDRRIRDKRSSFPGRTAGYK